MAAGRGDSRGADAPGLPVAVVALAVRQGDARVDRDGAAPAAAGAGPATTHHPVRRSSQPVGHPVRLPHDLVLLRRRLTHGARVALRVVLAVPDPVEPPRPGPRALDRASAGAAGRGRMAPPGHGARGRGTTLDDTHPRHRVDRRSAAGAERRCGPAHACGLGPGARGLRGPDAGHAADPGTLGHRPGFRRPRAGHDAGQSARNAGLAAAVGRAPQRMGGPVAGTVRGGVARALTPPGGPP